ncbi:MAG: hypothetical protein K0S44_2631 [Bacteroidetes bacterium]|nr:hypothetical protein [Bacteroidota bacterium]
MFVMISYSEEFRKFNIYKHFKEAFRLLHKHEVKYNVDEKIINEFIKTNPEYFETYSILGTYYKDRSDKIKALKYYNLALSKEITTMQDKEEILRGMEEVSGQ